MIRRRHESGKTMNGNFTICVRVCHLFVGHYSGGGIVHLSADKKKCIIRQCKIHKIKHTQKSKN